MFQYKTEPYDHQRKIFDDYRNRVYFGYLAEMGTGKSKMAIDSAAWLWSENHIDALLIVAPNGVHRNWTRREVPTHMPDWTDYRAVAWSSTMKAEEKRLLDAMLVSKEKWSGLRIISVNVEAYSVAKKHYDAKLGEYMRLLTTLFNVMVVVDESSSIKTPGAQCTKRLTQLSKRTVARRIATGTAITNSPLDAFSQFRFLSPDILEFTNFYSFKNHYAEYQQVTTKQGTEFPMLVAYKNMDELAARIAKHSVRVLKKDCLDLPPKVFMRRELVMAEKQRRIYNRMREDALLELQGDSEGQASWVQHHLTRLVRLRQILGGFVPKDPDDPENSEVEVIFERPTDNPKFKALLDIMEENGDSPTIVFFSFVAELELVARYLKDKCVTYYGKTSEDDRDAAIDRFQSGEVQYFLGTRPAMYGLTLTRAELVVYYSNSYRLDDRLQSEDRAHRAGLQHPVTYIDLVFPGTKDMEVIEALKNKKRIADIVNRDQNVEDWL